MLWAPSSSNETLQKRALFLKNIRSFFDDRGVMEVDTPVLYSGVATDPGLHAFAVSCGSNHHQELRYLQTSPEFPMKRLLAQGSGPIYYLGKAFRKGEVGARHNPEFTLLEWYRPQWDHWQLIDEVEALFNELLATNGVEHHTYQGLFEARFNINPHVEPIEGLQNLAIEQQWVQASSLPEMDRDGWLDLLLCYGIEPHLGQSKPAVVVDYPASQASLAKTRLIETDDHAYYVAERFEFYYRGVELANGYHELTCSVEQQRRFEEDLEKRKLMGLTLLPIDHALLAALSNGFPECAGVAIGIDRLLMLKLKGSNIAKVLPFAWEQA